MKTLTSLLALAALAMVLEACPASTCGPSNCTGCCDANGACQGGAIANACGTTGGACLVCALGQTCNLGQCGATQGSGGGSQNSGGGTGTGGGSQSGGGTGGGSSGPLTPETFCIEYFNTLNALTVTCGQATQRVGDAYAAFYAMQCATVLPGVKDGRASFDTAAARACLDRAHALTCFTSSSTALESCASIVTGLVAANGACYASEDCASGLFCDSTMTCPGACRPRVALGQPTTDSTRCVANAYAYNGVCTAYVAVGQSCAPLGGSQNKQICAGDATCDTSERCVGRSMLGDVGASCVSERDCGVGRYCLSSVCTALGRPNSPCDSVRPCQNGTSCSATNTCLAWGIAGDACSAQVQCESGLFCNGSSSTPGTCAPRRTSGQSCTASGYECATDLYCSATATSSGTCRPLEAVGGACTFFGAQCQSTLYCTATSQMNGVCAVRKGLGATCASYEECESQTCTMQRCVASSSCRDPTP